MSLTESLIAGLLRRGETELLPTSKKYRRFTRKHGEFYFVGKAGALRIGKTVTTSIPVSPSTKEFFLNPRFC